MKMTAFHVIEMTARDVMKVIRFNVKRNNSMNRYGLCTFSNLKASAKILILWKLFFRLKEQSSEIKMYHTHILWVPLSTRIAGKASP